MLQTDLKMVAFLCDIFPHIKNVFLQHKYLQAMKEMQ